ncbi:hypothetical protein ACLMAL_21745 [Nocardia sp. CWNU-33]|uniref:hypothetical protein n=1 Tax=Nocardia sp. CWNU-33 TaxID=3392117 RepID=UPI00398EB3E4
MSIEGFRSVAAWEQVLRLFELVLGAIPPTLLGWGLLSPLGDWMGVSPVQRVALWLALVVQPIAIVISRREPPQGRLLVALRSTFFATYAAVVVGVALKLPDENLEILSIPLYFALIGSLHVLYERCVKPTKPLGSR